MSQELERINATQAIAVDFAKSGYFADARSAEQAFVKVMAGREMGLEPFQSMTGIHIIQGKPVVGAGLLAAMLDRHPEYDYQVEWEPEQATATACTVIVFKGGKERGRSRFSLEDKQRAGLTQQNWSKYPTAMLYARAMSQAVRWYAPGLTGTSVYVEGEIAPSDAAPDTPPATVVATVVPYVDPDDPLDDVPFDVAPASPETPAESPPLPTTGQIATDEEPAAEQPGTNGGGLFIDTDLHAREFLKMLDAEQLGVMKRMLGISGKTTRLIMAEALLDAYRDWDSQDVLGQLSGWA